MAMTIHVDIVSAEEKIFSGLAEMLIAPAEDGEVGITARHAPLLTRLRPGEVRVKTGKAEDLPFFISGGILEVQPHVVSVLADRAVRAKDIDEAKAIAAKKRAEETLSDKSGKLDYAKAQLELIEAVALLQTLDRWRKNT